MATTTITTMSSRSSYIDAIEKGLYEGMTAMEKPSLLDGITTKGMVPPRYKVLYAANGCKSTLFKGPMGETCLLETTSDSLRCSVYFKKQDDLERIIVREYMRVFTGDHASRKDYRIVQKLPTPHPNVCFDMSFLITNRHVQDYGLEEIAACVVQFVTNAPKQKSDMKITMNARARQVAREYCGK